MILCFKLVSRQTKGIFVYLFVHFFVYFFVVFFLCSNSVSGVGTIRNGFACKKSYIYIFIFFCIYFLNVRISKKQLMLLRCVSLSIQIVPS
jgi:hypothetical protein